MVAVSQNSSFQSPTFAFMVPIRLRNAVKWAMRCGREVNSKPGSSSSATRSSMFSGAFCASFHKAAAARLSALAILIDSSRAAPTTLNSAGFLSLVGFVASSVICVSGPPNTSRLSVTIWAPGSLRPRFVKGWTAACAVMVALP